LLVLTKELITFAAAFAVTAGHVPAMQAKPAGRQPGMTANPQFQPFEQVHFL